MDNQLLQCPQSVLHFQTMKSLKKILKDNRKQIDDDDARCDVGSIEEDIQGNTYKYFTCPSIVDIKVIDRNETEVHQHQSMQHSSIHI